MLKTYDENFFKNNYIKDFLRILNNLLKDSTI